MKISLIMTGKTRAGWLNTGIQEYSGRLRHYVTWEELILPDLKNTRSMPQSDQKLKEGRMILQHRPSGSMLILLDEGGREYSSPGLSQFIEKKMAEGRSLCFAIGGPYGFSDEVYKAADDKISLSKLTFSHQMVRLIFLEQLYRAFTIIKGEPYHHA
jgi:23S rRNA (pseudouridine1915-N3)-methyltransferase